MKLSLYFVVYPTTSEFLRDRLVRVCESFASNAGGARIELPQRREELTDGFKRARGDMDSLVSTLQLTIDNFKSYLKEIQAMPGMGEGRIEVYQMCLAINKSTYEVMNRLHVEQKGHRHMAGLFWVPKKYAGKV